MNERLPPIPTPAAQLWRQLRLEYLPVVVFAAGILAAATIWTRWVAPPTLVGEVEAIRAELRSAQTGLLSGLELDLLQDVVAGQTIGHVIPNDPKVLNASLAVIRAEIETMRHTLEPVIGQQRMSLDFDQLQLDWMSKRVDLASLQGQLVQAEATLARTAVLHQNRMVPEERYDEAKFARDALGEQIKTLSELIKHLEPRLRDFSSNGDPMIGSPAEGLRSAIREKEEQLRLVEAQLGPVPLVAPIDGVVTLVHRRAGETVAAGEPILQISATRAERIIGFIREPIQVEPKPGMTVEVRTRTFQRHVGTAIVAKVGRHMEPISPTLLAAMRLPVSTIPTELGLRVLVTTPTGLDLRPGEHVDLILRD